MKRYSVLDRAGTVLGYITADDGSTAFAKARRVYPYFHKIEECIAHDSEPRGR